MAAHEVNRLYERKRANRALKAGRVIVGLFLCIGAASQSASGKPPPDEPTQWKQSIERPNRGWDYDGERILGHVGFDICLWDATTGELLHRMKGHKELIHQVQFSPDGHHALSSSWMPPGPMQPGLKSKDTSTILWNLGTGRQRDIFKDEVAGEFSPDGRRFLTFTQRLDKLETTNEYTNSETGEVTRDKSTVPVNPRFDSAAVWETYTGRQLVKAKLDIYSDPKSDTLHFSPDGRSFVYFKGGASLLNNSSQGVLYDTSDGREIGRVGQDGAHRYTSSGALASFDPQRAILTDLKSSQVIESIPHGLKLIWAAAWTHDGRRVAVIPLDERVIKFWDLEAGKVTSEAKSHPVTARRAIISPDNGRLAIESGVNVEDAPEVGLYDMNTGEEIARIKLAKWGHMLGFSPDSKTLLVGGSPFVIYNAENGKEIRTLNLLDDASFSHDWHR